MPDLGCLVTPSSCLATQVAHATVGDLIGSLSALALVTVKWLLGGLGSFLSTTSDVSAIHAGASVVNAQLSNVAPFVVLIALVYAVIDGVRHGDGTALWRTFLGVTPITIVAMRLAMPMATLVLQVDNAMISQLAGSTATTMSSLTRVLVQLPASVPGLGVATMAVAGVLGAGCLWLELVARNVALTFVVAAAPVVLALGIVPGLRRIGWRLFETVAVLAFSKYAVTLTLVVGVAEFTSSSTTGVLVGLATLALASLMPLFLVRLVPLMDHSAMHQFAMWRQQLTTTALRSPASPSGRLARRLWPEEELRVFEPGGDFGIPEAESDGDIEMPPTPDVRPRAPLEYRLRHGHVVIQHDRMGPVIGWEWDD